MAISSRRPMAFNQVGAASRAATCRPRLGRPTQHGFTLVELLVVIAIIGTLVALLLPAVQSARERARQNTCLNNIGNLAKAMVNYDSSKQSFPGYLQNVRRSPTTYATIYYDSSAGQVLVRSTTSPSEIPVPFSWATMLLSRVEEQVTWDQIVSSDTSLPPVPIRRITVFSCPSDSEANSVKDRPALSYVANTGAWDRDSSGKPLSYKGNGFGDTVANGVFYDLTASSKLQSRMSGIRDGARSTLMLSENIHRSYESSPPGAPLFCWAASGSPPGDPTKGQPSNAGSEQQFGMVWVVSLSPQVGTNLDNQEAMNRNSSDVIDFRNDIPLFARPASSHHDGANVAFCDGSAQFLHEGIDYTVYQRLMTSYGAKCVDPQNWTNGIPGVIDTLRKLPPLSPDDYGGG